MMTDDGNDDVRNTTQKAGNILINAMRNQCYDGNDDVHNTTNIGNVSIDQQWSVLYSYS
jgi:hypothetical protein